MSMSNPNDIANTPLFGRIAAAKTLEDLQECSKHLLHGYLAGLISDEERQTYVLAIKTQRASVSPPRDA